jgi:Ca2+-binding EF-hand superfamily protein
LIARACWGAVPLLLAAAVHAQGSRAAYLGFFDRDGDGKIDVAEYVQYMSRGFARMDVNGDDRLERNELPGRRGEPVSLAAFQDNLRRQFHRMDRNHDGSLDARELTAPPR